MDVLLVPTTGSLKRRNDDDGITETNSKRLGIVACGSKGKSDRPTPVPATAMAIDLVQPPLSPDTSYEESVAYGYHVLPTDKKFGLFYNFLKRRYKQKVIVIFSSPASVVHHRALFTLLKLNCSVLHELQDLKSRESTLADFCNATSGTLLCSNAAARGLAIPGLDWIVQYDPPQGGATDYIEKVVQLAQGRGFECNALLFLNQSELPFIRHLEAANVFLARFQLVRPRWKPEDLQALMEKIVDRRFELNKSAIAAYQSYISAYDSHPIKDIFDLEQLDLQAVAASFCLQNPPLTMKDVQQQAQWDEISLMLENFSLDSLQKKDVDDVLNRINN